MHPPNCQCRDCTNDSPAFPTHDEVFGEHTPDVDYTNGAREALQAVLAAVGRRREEGEQDLRQIAADVRRIAGELGVTL